jgi:hypothetical protein
MQLRIWVVGLLAACGGSSSTPDASTGSFAIGGTVSGLTGTGLVLQVQADIIETVPIAGNGPFTLGSFPTGTDYAITVGTHPTAPDQICRVGRGTGRVAGADVSVEVTCGDPDLLISEIGSCFYASFSCWVEIANPTASARNLGDYELRSTGAKRSTPYTVVDSEMFDLPSLTIPPGGYAIVRGKTFDDLIDGPQIVSVHTNTGVVPNWRKDGFVELVRAGQTVDFVRFGMNSALPTTVGWFGGAAMELPEDYGHALARSQALVDNDGRTDWTVRAFATPCGPNDITRDDDADVDGIPDQAEEAGSTYAGIDLHARGARVSQRDIFVEIDHMDHADPGVTPRKEALEKVVAAFAVHQIALHLDVGNLYSPVFDPANFNLGGGNVVAFSPGLTLEGGTPGRASLFAYKAAHFDPRLSTISHYSIFGYTDTAAGVPTNYGGLGELEGNDFIVVLGNSGLNASTPENTHYLIHNQADTFMHELGHNLGLHHGGNEEKNYKPNYRSSMNYMNGPGLPIIGNNEGDRYHMSRYFRFGSGCGITQQTQLVAGPFTSAAIIDYSNGAGGAINEAAVVESQGLRYPGSGPVDFDCSGGSGTYSRDLNDDGMIDTLTDHDDWGNLKLVFARKLSGASLTPRRTFDPLASDRQRIAVETRY